MSEIDRALILLAPDKFPVQRLSVVNRLPQLYRDYPTETLEKLFPRIIVPKHKASFNVVPLCLQLFFPVFLVADTFLQEGIGIFGGHCRVPEQHSEGAKPANRICGSSGSPNSDNFVVPRYRNSCLLVRIVGCVAPIPLPKIHQYDGRNTFFRTHQKTSSLSFSVSDLFPQIVPFALGRGEPSEPTQSRVLCCRILGQCSLRLPTTEIETSFLKQILAMCQDTSFDVRICMCEQLTLICPRVR